MTHLAGDRGRRAPRAWLIPVAAVVAVLAAAATEYLSRSVVIDFLAWWPIWALLALGAISTRGRRLGRVELSGLVALVAVLVVGAFTIGHLEAWPTMPSSTLRLVGPETDADTTVSITARIDGTLRIHSGVSPFLYVVVPIRRGGGVAMADAIEQVQGPAVSVGLIQVDDPGPYTFSGWDVMLDESVSWSIDLGGDLEADLSGLVVDELRLGGNGVVVLAETSEPTPVAVQGGFEVIVPRQTPVRVVGQAIVPAGWAQSPDGWVAPIDGEGWVLTVDAGTTVIVSNP
jgi:hypothetical protein